MQTDRKPTVLFVTYGGGHVNMVVPVAKALLAQGDTRVEVLGLTTAGPVLKQAGVPSFGFRDIVQQGDEAALTHGRRLVEGLPQGLVPYEESVAYLGLSYADLEIRLGPEEAARQYVLYGRQAFLPITVMERVIKKINPNIIVTTNSPRCERAAIIAARKLGIPALCMVDFFGIQEMSWIGEAGYADRVCVLMESVRQRFLDYGRRADEVVVTGNPAFDRLAHPDLRDQATHFRTAHGWQGRRVILWASQPEPECHPFTGVTGDPALPRRVDDSLMNLLSRHTDWHLVIRPHPSESLSFDALPERVEISTGNDDLAVLLQAVDVVVTMSSTVGLEAVLLNKPLVALGFSVFSPDAPYADLGLGRGVETLDDLEAGICEVLAGNWHPNVLLRPMGQATKRVLDEIRSLLHKSRSARDGGAG